MQLTLPTHTLGSELVKGQDERDDGLDGAAVTAATDLAHVINAQQDIRAFAPLYESYAPVIYAYCFRRLSHRENAADAAALVFTRAIAALPRFKPDRSRTGSTFRAWLFTIAHNVVVDAHRRSRDHLSLDLHHDALSATGQLQTADQSPEEIALANESTANLNQHLARLSERQRAIVELRMAGLSGKEISQALGMSESAIKSAQFRAYATLRAHLQPSTDAFTPENFR